MPALPIYGPLRSAKSKRGAPGAGLMERAGLAAAELARRLCGDTAKAVLVVAGPGNNGGDAFEVAVHLKRWSFASPWCSPVSATDCQRTARRALGKWEEAEERCSTPSHTTRFGLVVDGLFVIGLKRPLEGRHRYARRAAQRAGVRSFARRPSGSTPTPAR